MALNQDNELLVYYVLELQDCFGDERSIYAGAASPDGRTKLVRVDKHSENSKKRIKSENIAEYKNIGRQKSDEKSEIDIKIDEDFVPEYPFNPAEIKVTRVNVRSKPGFFC